MTNVRVGHCLLLDTNKKITTRLRKVATLWTPYFTMSWFRLRRAEEQNNMLGYIVRQLFFSEGLYTFFLWGFFIFCFLYFFYIYILYFFWLGGGSFMSHPFYVLFGAISRLALSHPWGGYLNPRESTDGDFFLLYCGHFFN